MRIKLKKRMAGPGGNFPRLCRLIWIRKQPISWWHRSAAEWVDRPIEKAVTHLGGGWYEVGGVKVQGKDKAYEMRGDLDG